METETLTLTVSAERMAEYLERLARVLPTTAHPLPGERILDLALAALDRQVKVREWRQRRSATLDNHAQDEEIS